MVSETKPTKEPTTTKSGYPLDEVSSVLQKSIRRADEKIALFFAFELFPRSADILWQRLQVIAAEDIENANACTIVNSLRSAFYWNNKNILKVEDLKNRIFITKAVLYLCRQTKSREADHAQHYIDECIKNGEKLTVPDYALDVHTKRGRANGKTTAEFYLDEHAALHPQGLDAYYNKLKFDCDE